MIDDKKIEEAARGAADLYEQDLPIMSYEENTEVDGQHHFCQGFGAELFKDGVHWAINEFLKDLWHNASEKPVMSEHGMILVELNDITACKYSLWRSTTTYECLCNNKGYIRRWLYLEDILLKGGEK